MKGWRGSPPVTLDGDNWPLDFAAKLLDIPEKDLRDLVRISGLSPAGTMKMATYARSGRHPRVYSAAKLIRLAEGMRVLSEKLNGTEDDS